MISAKNIRVCVNLYLIKNIAQDCAIGDLQMQLLINIEGEQEGQHSFHTKNIQFIQKVQRGSKW